MKEKNDVAGWNEGVGMVLVRVAFLTEERTYGEGF